MHNLLQVRDWTKSFAHQLPSKHSSPRTLCHKDFSITPEPDDHTKKHRSGTTWQGKRAHTQKPLFTVINETARETTLTPRVLSHTTIEDPTKTVNGFSLPKDNAVTLNLICSRRRYLCHKWNPRHNPFCSWEIVLQTVGHLINHSDKRSYPIGIYATGADTINWVTDLHLGI